MSQEGSSQPFIAFGLLFKYEHYKEIGTVKEIQTLKEIRKSGSIRIDRKALTSKETLIVELSFNKDQHMELLAPTIQRIQDFNHS